MPPKKLMKTRKKENSSKLREHPFAEEFSEMGVVSSVNCRAILHLSGTKGDFVWAGSAGKRTSCGVLFIVVECSELHCSDEFS